ncbi:hypothetical protein BU24DRAFT_211443 [Aaosphaeria arxii CBS 175.79]|uniref:Ricin B lectin domain-containing protein n=1 Tax=Aaosphaeria arxii CBS 175.79 TaxID=1450172 RepID=A0A6A5XPA9_9PLEO|nr:uncharacterized protein BU24DRAFT_211443 [Aaosphaeria arxii CBS 175.79]KAF2014184.1 hypothetical protein BU24DRAFT_211443 [Aaosphaeria arxii CBS 175.79]
MDFRTNSWYRISSAASIKSQKSMTGTNHGAGGEGIVSSAKSDNNLPTQQWQLYPVASSVFMLRTKASGPSGYLGTAKQMTSEKQIKAWISNSTNLSMLWRIEPWGDGTFHFSNVEDGAGYHLDLSDPSGVHMNKDIIQPQPGQAISFVRLDDIDDSAFSTVNAPSSQTATLTASASNSPSSTAISHRSLTASNLPTSSITSSPSLTTGLLSPTTEAHNLESKPVLSMSAAMGVGIAVGVLSIILITAITAFLYQRWKWRRSPEALHYRRAKLWKGFTPQYLPSKFPDGLILNESPMRHERIWVADFPIFNNHGNNTPAATAVAVSTPMLARSPRPSTVRIASWGSVYGSNPGSPEFAFMAPTPSPPVEMPV